MGDMGISDSEDLLVTSIDGDHHLENFVGASLFTKKEGDFGTHFKLGDNRQHDDVVGVVKSNVGFTYDCYSPLGSRDCFDDGYPLLIDTRQGVEGLGSYHEPFVTGSCFYAREDRVLCHGLNGQKSEECLNGAVVFDEKCRVSEECSNGKDRESKGCDAISAGKFDILEECPIENGSVGNECNGINADKYRDPECSDYQVGYTGRVQDAELQEEGVGGVSADIQKEWADEKVVEKNICNGISVENYQFGHSEGNVEDVKIQMHFTDVVSGECIPCNADDVSSAFAESRKDLDMEVIGDTDISLCGSVDMDNATLEHHASNLEQQSLSIICAKTMGRQPSRQKKPTYIRKRAPRKSSQKEENFGPSTGDDADHVTTDICKGLDVSTDGLMCSSSIVPSREQTSGSVIEVNGKFQASSATKDTDAVLSSDTNIGIGRITRSKAQRKLHLKSVVHDSLSDENNAIFAHKMTGKRSVLCKTIRSTVWGGLENMREGADKTSITSKSELSFTGAEFGERNIHSEVIQNHQRSKGRNGVRREKSGKRLEYGQSELINSPVFINCVEKDDNLQRDGLQGQGFLMELGGTKMHMLNVQGGELLCTNDDIHSQGRILRHKDIEEEHKYLEAQNDQNPCDQINCYLPHEVPKTLRNVEEENQANGHLSKLDKMNIEAEVPQNFTVKQRGSGVKGQELGKFCDNGQLQHVEFPVNGSSIHCENKENDDQEKGVLQDQSVMKESILSNGHVLNVQRSEVLCFSEHIHYGQGIGRQEKADGEKICLENEIKQCPNDQPNFWLPLEIPKSLGEVEGKNTVHGYSGEFCQKNIEGGVQPSQQRRKKRIGPKRQRPGKNENNSQTDQVKVYLHCSTRNYRKTKNARQEKVLLWNEDSVKGTGGPEEHGPSIQGSELLCLNGNCRKNKNARQEKVVLWDEGSVKGTGGPEEQGPSIQGSELLCLNGNQNFEGEIWSSSIDEENERLETGRDRLPVVKSKCLPSIGFSESRTKLEENYRTHGHYSEQLVPIFMNESKCHVSSSTVKTEISQQGFKENNKNVFHVIHEKENNVNPGKQAATSVRQTCGILTDESIKSLEPNNVISKIELQDEQETCDTQIVTTEMHLRIVESTMSMEVLNLCKTEPKDTVSVTSHGNTIERASNRELRKNNGQDKEKKRGEAKLSNSGVGVENGTLGGLDISLDQNAVKKKSKSRRKNTEMKVTVRGRKSTSKKQRNIFYADSNDLAVHTGLLLKEAGRKVSCKLQGNFDGEEVHTWVKVEPKEDVNLENSFSHDKCQGRENLKKGRGSNRKAESTGSPVIRERKRNVARQTNIAGDKKILSRKNKQVRNRLQSSSRSDAKSGKNDVNNPKITGQGKTLHGDLSEIKGQLDSCTDALSPLKIASTFSSGEQKNKEKLGLACLSQGSAEKDVLKSKISERRGMPGCNNEVTGEDVSSVVSEVEAMKIVDTVNHDKNEERFCGLPRVGWVSCDHCQKWRRMPVELVDAIDETKCKWTCQDNPNKEFADCSIPQEKSNAEINAELNISDVSCEEGDFNGAPSISKDHVSMRAHDSHQTSWTLIKRNMFLYRTHKTQAIDEIMVCHCKPPEDGSFGCGDECLNRLLNIECVKGTCPCGDLCSNQLFQKRQYAKVRLLRCGKKGFGLQILEEKPKGLFIIEYVGEVLDMQAYDARQKEYALIGQKHFYFMTLSSNEVIDACVKGNLGRFINHSCDPNCRTEKWMVNGEVRIGLFAIRDINKGEELTFDYNYERVFGAAAKKCECGSTECRGFIGGDQSTPTVVLPSEPDDEYPLPLMLHEESENDSAEENDMLPQKIDSIFCDVSQVEHSFQHAEKKGQCSLAQHEKQAEISSNCGTNESIGIPAMGNVLNLKKSIVRTNTGRFEGVEEKLNELLDSEGGISKRKDAARQYLKLLLVTAASGDTSNGEASHSTRDLSMILDALLKTRSRTVLIDIINKNGLQMLHNLLKQNCGTYNKTPIIRKLLKVLEFLATKDVLTVDHINSGPPCRGRESFKASICALIGHNDWQVQQIARSFRDNWIFHSIKTFKSRERSLSNEPALTVSDHLNNRSKFSVKRQKNLIPRDTDAIDCTSQIPREPENDTQSPSTWSDHCEGIHDTQDNNSGKDITKNLRGNHSFDSQMGGTGLRKRKSRWDQPTEPIVHESFAQTALENVETKVKQGKESGSLIFPSETANVPGLKHDGSVHKWYSEEKSMNKADINIPYQDSVVQNGKFSIPSSEEMSIINGSEAFMKQHSSVQSTMEQTAQFPANAHSCMASICTPSCSTERPCVQPFIMGYPQGKTAFGYEAWKSHGSIPAHLTLSFGIPFFFLEQSRRVPYAKADCVGQPLLPPKLHCKPNGNLMAASMQQNISCRPFVGQPIVKGFPPNPNNQGRPPGIPLQTHSIHPLKSAKPQTLEMHPRDLMDQYPSAISEYMDPEPPVPGLSPRRSSENPHDSNRPVRVRNKTPYDQTLKPCKGQWKNQKPNSRLFSKFNGYSNRKYKDGFHRRRSFLFKSQCKERFPANFHSDQNLQNLSNGNVLDFGKEQKLENINFVNLSKDVGKNFPPFH